MQHLSVVLLIAVVGCEACSGDSGAEACIPATTAADLVHTVIEADRATYAEKVAHRLHNIDKVIGLSESYEEDKSLPLPSQMLRMGAASAAASHGGRLRYALISEWAINKANMPKTQFEKQGLKALASDSSKPYRAYQELEGERYFMTLYPDKAVSKACVDCHNQHAESPRSDFELGEVMGGVVVTLRMD